LPYLQAHIYLANQCRRIRRPYVANPGSGLSTIATEYRRSPVIRCLGSIRRDRIISVIRHFHDLLNCLPVFVVDHCRHAEAGGHLRALVIHIDHDHFGHETPPLSPIHGSPLLM